MRVFFTNLGCKLNQAEMERLAREFVAAGHEVAPALAAADLHVVNSCTVTHAAARDSRKAARRGRVHGDRLRTVLTGCYVESSREEAAALAGVDLVVPNRDKERLVERVHAAFPELAPAGGDGPVPVPYVPVPYVPLDFGNTRALVKVEDGCNMRCTFCVIPATRGRQRSRPLDEVVAEVGALTATGFREVVLTGVQISAYRWRRSGLYELVAALLERTTVPRLRLTSIAPWQFDRRLLGLFAGGRLCRHVHLSLQSGSTPTLRRMRRPYGGGDFAALVAEVRRAVPGVAVTTDVIVGFPGETEPEFEESLRFTDAMRFARVHAFPYSSRPGTAAAALPGHLPPAVKKARMERMLRVARQAERRFWWRHAGGEAQVLWERRRNGRWLGTTDNYIRVVAASDADLGGRLTRARLGDPGDEFMRCRVLDAPPDRRSWRAPAANAVRSAAAVAPPA